MSEPVSAETAAPTAAPSIEFIAGSLKRLVRGEVRSDPYARSLYSTDASIYEIEPLVVVNPVDEDDVTAAVKFAAEHRIPIIARGAGSGLTGESLGRAIVLDMNVHMARIVELDRQNRTVVVEAGVVLDSLNRALKTYGFRFGPDPASSNRCTLGGMISNNACGARSLKYGATRDNLVSCRVVLADGTVTNFRPVTLNGGSHSRKQKEKGLAGKVNREIPPLLQQHANLIASRNSKSERNRSGYLLDGVVADGVFDPVRLICASEGTLGIVTEAVLKVVPLPARAGVAVVAFETLSDAARAVPAIREVNPVACELFDAMVMHLGRKAAPEKAHLLPEGAGAMLAVEFDGPDADAVNVQLRALQERLQDGVKHQSIRLVMDPQEQTDLWQLRKKALPYLYQRDDGLQPIAIVEDACVPVDRLDEYLSQTVAVFEKHGLEYTAYGHAGHGEPHLRPLLDLTKPEHVALLEPIAEACHQVVWNCGGTISGEHGEGLARAQWIPKQAGPELFAVFKQVKAIFDPQGILNPDKKITNDAHLMTKNLRHGANFKISSDGFHSAGYSGPRVETRELPPELAHEKPRPAVHAQGPAVLNWKDFELGLETGRCNGNGFCRSTGPEVDMCPRFRYNRVEDAAPRAKANLIRRLLSGRQQVGSFADPEVIQIADYCFNCKLCVDDCPSAVNIPKLATEMKARYHRENRLPLSKWIFVKTELFARAGRWLAPIVNTVNEMTITRWFMEKFTGIDRRRKLPRFKNWRLRHKNTYSVAGPRPKVVLYTDLYAKYYAPEVAQAAVDVLEHHGHEVVVPEDLPWTNMPALMHGAVGDARKTIETIVAGLVPYARKGYPIVVTEPTAALCLSQEFLDYCDTADARLVARQVRDFGAYLAELKVAGTFKTDFHSLPLTVGYHAPCHLKALKVGTPGMDLLKLIPGVKVEHIDEGCCGIAGTFGMTKKNYDESMWIGRGLFKALAKPELKVGSSECSTCKMQMEHGTGKVTLHPAQILAAAYGYEQAMPLQSGFTTMDVTPETAHHADDDHAAPAHAEKKEAHHAEPAHAGH
ncbi:MAG: dimethylmenaquinone methyltransferase [Planctomycetota bacterium]